MMLVWRFNCWSRPVFGLLFSAFFLFFWKCRSDSNASIRPAFFYWKTEMAISDFEKNKLKSLNVNKLYLRLFDIDLDGAGGQPLPMAILNSENFEKELAGFELTGCVFITSRVFENGLADPDFLAKKTTSLLRILGEKLPGGLPKKLLFDCDWTPSTREPFFLFLKKMGEKLPGHELGATIRLHQFKFPEETGVPPVASGVLMCYNTGELTDWATENSILDSVSLKKYLRGSVGKYPLPLDVALPVFGWGVVFRGGDFFKIINGLERTQLIDNQRFTAIASNRFSIKKETILNGIYLHPGDLIRLEKPSSELVLMATQELRRLGSPNSKDPTVGFYHLDSAAIGGFSDAFFRTVFEKK